MSAKLIDSLAQTSQEVVVVQPFVSRRRKLEELIDLYLEVTKVYADRAEELEYVQSIATAGTRQREHVLALGLLSQNDLLTVYQSLADFGFYHPEEVALAFERMHKAVHSYENEQPNYHLANRALSLGVALLDFKRWLGDSERDGAKLEKYKDHRNYSYLYREALLVD